MLIIGKSMLFVADGGPRIPLFKVVKPFLNRRRIQFLLKELEFERS